MLRLPDFSPQQVQDACQYEKPPDQGDLHRYVLAGTISGSWPEERAAEENV
jgi:hypothetical protein